MTAAREVIEPQVARLAACNITPAEIARLRAIIDDAVDAFDEVGIVTLLYQDLEFHSTVANASRNRYLSAMAIELNTLMLRYWYISLTRAGHLKEDFVKHHDLIDLLEQRDESGIQPAMIEHIARFRRRMSAAITTDVPLGAL
jgi:DNA-binding GntR family transcriptional regulator